MMWMHWLQRLGDRCHSLFKSLVNRACLSMWHRSVDASPSCAVARGLGDSDVGNLVTQERLLD